MKTIKLSDIVISKSFLNSHPSEEKIKRYKEAYAKNKQQSKYIVLNDNNVLLDGYIQYLILKENNVNEAQCITKHIGEEIQKKFQKADIEVNQLYMYMALI